MYTGDIFLDRAEDFLNLTKDAEIIEEVREVREQEKILKFVNSEYIENLSKSVEIQQRFLTKEFRDKLRKNIEISTQSLNTSLLINPFLNSIKSSSNNSESSESNK